MARALFVTPGGTKHAYIITGHLVAGSPADAAAVALDVARGYTNAGCITSLLSNTVTLQAVSVVWNDTGVLKEGSVFPASSGGVASAAASPQVAILGHKNTGSIGRKFRGRMFIMGFPESQLDSTGGLLTNTALTNWQTAINAAVTAWVTNNVSPVILHRDTSVPPTVVGSITIEQNVATQRRRNRKAPHR